MKAGYVSEKPVHESLLPIMGPGGVYVIKQKLNRFLLKMSWRSVTDILLSKASLVLKKKKHDVTPLLKKLHWLQVECHIKYKMYV